ncbi:MAG TPA: tetratricopeptide repeat protein [Candidatus Wunengus sp. YC63]|uniref:tetratricopeptide repeat protein n=1 Tax=unclassified Candidatus Wunengus TaxID=3367695 RepID=UPI00402728CD
MPILISSISFLAYLNTLHHQFVFDDFRVITNNPYIKDWKYFPTLFNHDYFKISGELSYRPLVTASYFTDYAIWGLNSFGFHLTNLILHTLNTFIVYLLLSKITRNFNLTVISCLIFSIHPILTETVNSVGFREDLLCATFFLLALFFYVKRYTSKYKNICYIISLLTYFLSLFSKEMAISLPLIIFVLDWFFLQSRVRISHPRPNPPPSKGRREPGNLPIHVHQDDVEHFWGGQKSLKNVPYVGAENLQPLPVKTRLLRYYPGFILMSIGYMLLRLVFFKSTIEHVAYPGNSLVTNFLTMTKVIASYIKLWFFPIVLNPDYHVTFETTPIKLPFLISIALLACIAFLAVRLYRQQKEITFSILWIFITLTPVMNLIPIGNIMAERYLYLPSFGFCLFAGILILKIHARVPKAYHPLVKTCFAAIFILFLTHTIRHNRIWFDRTTLWSYAVYNTSCSFNAHNNLGKQYFLNGKIDEAMREYNIALSKASEIQYKYPITHHNLGLVYDTKGMYDDAMREYQNALRIDPKYSESHNNLGIILFKNKQVDLAIEEFNKAISFDPNNPIYHDNLAKLYYKINMPNEAKIEQDLANQLKP